MLNLIRNQIKTPDGTILRSYHRHDFVSYRDNNGFDYSIDGGLDYLKRGCAGPYEDQSLYDNEPFEVQREVVVWGTFGKDGKQPLKYIKISDMETDHIEKCLNIPNLNKIIQSVMVKELEYRSKK